MKWMILTMRQAKDNGRIEVFGKSLIMKTVYSVPNAFSLDFRCTKGLVSYRNVHCMMLVYRDLPSSVSCRD